MMKWILVLFLGAQFTFGQSIEDYFQQIPDSVFQLCNWRDTSENGIANHSIKTLDIKNGFIGFKRNEEEHDFFQAAVYRGSEGQSFILIRNQACEHCCCEEPKTFVYLVENGKWKNVTSTHFPKMELKDFITQDILLKNYGDVNNYAEIQVQIPQHGTVSIAKVLFCDYVVEDEIISSDLYERIEKALFTREINFDKKENLFKLK
ncbi:MAG: hypothetical protein KDC84_03630 [Crocinitomicaceae bacterium]|nr:hypothetical protein [Crocinitomicaceae bacterium]